VSAWASPRTRRCLASTSLASRSNSSQRTSILNLSSPARRALRTERASSFAGIAWASGAATALVVLLLAFAAIMTVQARRIARERDRANQEAATGPKGILFPDGEPNLVHARPTQIGAIERQRADQKVVEQHAERTDVAAGVHIDGVNSAGKGRSRSPTCACVRS
jgi:hypothetical protein